MEVDKNTIKELIQRQMAILGLEMTLARVRRVPGIQIDASGHVTGLQGDSQVILTDLTNQFIELSGLIVKKTMETILSKNTDFSPPVAQVQTHLPPTPTMEDRQVLSAQKDLENLSKMLNTVGTTE